MVFDAEAHFALRDWQEARVRLEKALAKGGSEPSLGEITLRARRLLADTDARLAEQQERRQAKDKYLQFSNRRDEAMFQGALFTGTELPANVEATRFAASQALRLFGLSLDGKGSLAFEASFSKQERDDITDGCYELLLIVAEVAAGQDHIEEALQLLNQARGLRPTTKAFHLRHARYLQQSGDLAGAEQEIERAASLQPNSVDYFLLGDDQRRHGDVRGAIQHFENALRIQPDHFWAHYFLAVCFLSAEVEGAGSTRRPRPI